MSTSPTRCPACQAACPPQADICDTCGRVLGSPIPATIPLAALPQPATLPVLLQPGQSLARGRYTIQRQLSQGGMGALYLATDHEAFDRTVVIKALLGQAAGASPTDTHAAQARFEREARTLATLSYPTIPQIFSYFQEAGQNYIVMAYIEGRDLAQGLTRHDPASGRAVAGQPYPIAEVLHWGVALCRTLEYLAGRTPPVIHQDIKPANLILNAGSSGLYLVDFGAARARMLAPAGQGGQTMVFGTPGYAAPEQYQGHSEPRSDVYALAATLYHLVTDDDPGAHPFEFPRLPYLGYLGPILRCALSPDPAQRPDAAGLREQIEALLTPAGLRTLQAPDGLALANEGELAQWCEQHWEDATHWLYAGLPDQVQIAWVKLPLAESLRRCAREHPHAPDAGLDAALALLDRTGFGTARPALVATSSTIDIDTFAVDVVQMCASGRLIIRNSGRRYLQAKVSTPRWMSTPTPTIALRPGQQAALDLQIDLRKAPSVPQNYALGITPTAGTGISVPLQGQSPILQRQSLDPRWAAVVVLIWILCVCLVTTVLPLLR